MRELYVNTDSINENLNIQDLKQESNLVKFLVKKGEDLVNKNNKVLYEHLLCYANYFMRHKDMPVENVNKKVIEQNFKKSSVLYKVAINNSRTDYWESTWNNLDKAYSDWTSKFLGYQLILPNGYKIIFMPHKDKIMTDLPRSIKVNDYPEIEKMFNLGVLKYEKS